MASVTERLEARRQAIREGEAILGQPFTERSERYGRPEPAPYHGWCGACRGWYFRGAETRWHFGADGSAAREHVRCEPGRQRGQSSSAGARPAVGH